MFLNLHPVLARTRLYFQGYAQMSAGDACEAGPLIGG